MDNIELELSREHDPDKVLEELLERQPEDLSALVEEASKNRVKIELSGTFTKDEAYAICALLDTWTNSENKND